jgi:hypothetical protein
VDTGTLALPNAKRKMRSEVHQKTIWMEMQRSSEKRVDELKKMWSCYNVKVSHVIST